MFDEPVRGLQGHQIFLAAVTVAELRYGAIIAEWGAPRRRRIEMAIAESTVCRSLIHWLHDRTPATVRFMRWRTIRR